MEVLTEQVVM
jgi:hypothetical protein